MMTPESVGVVPVSVDGDPEATAAKVDFLRRPESHAGRPAAVEVIETHFAWVFLTGRHAYKLKKPIRLGPLDLTTLEARRRSCEQEVILNRRLAEPTYLGVEALTVTAAGGLALGGDGVPVDWLVKMVQLPRERMMDGLIRARAVTPAELDALVGKLARFHRAAPACGGTHFVARIAGHLREARDELLTVTGPVRDLARDGVAGALRYVERQHGVLARRVADGRIREVHGDLRPEHVCLLPDPQIIDCLEFDQSLRTLDCIQEMAFLAMECALLGDREVGWRLLELYRRRSGDEAPQHLLCFYLGERAIVRAMLAARHLTDPAVSDPARWLGVAERYLRLAAESLAGARIAETRTAP
jgi:aminoglycoside phosphotransferase family enzyme